MYAFATALLALVVFPGLLYVSVRAGKWLAHPRPAGIGDREHSTSDLFIRLAYPLVPLGLLAWIAFSVPLIMVNGSYIISVISDPLGWGMNLFGTAGFHWRPLLPEWVPYLQVAILLLGLFWSLRSGFGVAVDLFGDRGRAARALAPVSAFVMAITVVFLALFVG